jgi:hypothetical protein
MQIPKLTRMNGNSNGEPTECFPLSPIATPEWIATVRANIPLLAQYEIHDKVIAVVAFYLECFDLFYAYEALRRMADLSFPVAEQLCQQLRPYVPELPARPYLATDSIDTAWNDSPPRRTSWIPSHPLTAWTQFAR